MPVVEYGVTLLSLRAGSSNMAVYTDLFIAAEMDMLTAPLEHDRPSEFFPTVQGKYITPLEFAELESLVAGKSLDEPADILQTAVEQMEQNLVRERESTWVYRLPEAFVMTLAHLTIGEVAKVSTEWAQSTGARPLDRKSVSQEDIVNAMHYLHEICQLASRALSENKQMYLWMAV
jgi:hypothetical protein